MSDSWVRLLECEPELGLRVPPDEVRRSRQQLIARVVSVEPGCCEPPASAADRGLGLLVLGGVLARETMLGGTTCAELVGEGDLLQPWLHRDERLVRYHVRWHVLERLRLAVLDERFTRDLGAWPTVTAAILERSQRRTQRMAVHQAILQLSPLETRLLMMLWHLAERWGRVTTEGVAVRLPLSHEMLSRLVGCRRASVTTALARVCAHDRLSRRADGTWVLAGRPPDGVTPVRWAQRRAEHRARVLV